MQGAEIKGKGAYLKYVTEPEYRTWLLSKVEVQQLDTSNYRRNLFIQ